MRSDRERLLDVLERIHNIRRYAPSRATLDDTLVADAVVHSFEVIGEAAKNVSAQLREAHPEVAWSEASRMRDRMAHGYFSVDLDVVWDAVDRDLPVLDAQVRAMLSELPE